MTTYEKISYNRRLKDILMEEHNQLNPEASEVYETEMEDLQELMLLHQNSELEQKIKKVEDPLLNN